MGRTLLRGLMCLAWGGALLHAGEVAVPTIPHDDPDWDWVRLDTGECLKGEIRVMYRDKVEFDSDHFGLITIDLDDIAEMRSTRAVAIWTGQETKIGKVVITEKEATVQTQQGTYTVDRDRIVSLAGNGEREGDLWTADITLSFNSRTGNVEQSDLSAAVHVERRTSVTRLQADYLTAQSESNGEEIDSAHRLSAYFDYYVSPRFFLRTIGGEYFRDRYQNIAHQHTYFSALGYTAIDTDPLRIDFASGPAWRQSEFVDGGGRNRLQSFGVVFSTDIEWELTEKLEFVGKYEFLWAEKNLGGFSGHTSSSLEYELSEDFDLVLTYIWDHVAQPKDSTVAEWVEPNDYRLMIGLEIEL